MKIGFVAAGALIAALMTASASAQVLNLSGQFRCVQGCVGGLPGPAYVTQNGWELNLVNEAGEPSRRNARCPGSSCISSRCGAERPPLPSGAQPDFNWPPRARSRRQSPWRRIWCGLACSATLTAPAGFPKARTGHRCSTHLWRALNTEYDIDQLR